MDAYGLLAIIIPVLGTIIVAIIGYLFDSSQKRKFILVEKLWDEKYRGFRELSVSLEALKDLLEDFWDLEYGVDQYDGGVEYNTIKIARKMEVEHGSPEEQSLLMSYIEFSSLDEEEKRKELARIQNKCGKRIEQKFVENVKKSRTLTRELSLLVGDKRILELSNDIISRISDAKLGMERSYGIVVDMDLEPVKTDMGRLSELANGELRWTRFDRPGRFWRTRELIKTPPVER